MKTDTEFDCPWCDGPMASTDDDIHSAACATCSIVVEFAPDPLVTDVALAA
jgi:transcription elongation factor Elf1